MQCPLCGDDKAHKHRAELLGFDRVASSEG